MHSSAEMQVGGGCFLVSFIRRRCQFKPGQMPCAVCPEFLMWPWCHKCFRTTQTPMQPHTRGRACDWLTVEPPTAGLVFVRLAAAFPLTALLCSGTSASEVISVRGPSGAAADNESHTVNKTAHQKRKWPPCEGNKSRVAMHIYLCSIYPATWPPPRESPHLTTEKWIHFHTESRIIRVITGVGRRVFH